MFGLREVELIEGEAESEQEYFCAVQAAINAMHAWHMQGSMGRAMMDAIDEGRCMLGHEATRDYWGNRIPSRTEVQDGTKGSRSFVVKHSGEDWALMLEEVS